MLGDNNVAFATDQNNLQIVAVDTSSGQTQWTYQVPDTDNDYVQIIAASSGGGVAAKVTDFNVGSDTIINLDSTGSPSQILTTARSPVTAALPSYSWKGDWFASPFSTFGASQIALPLLEDFASPWATLAGNPSGTETPGALCDCLTETTDPEPPPPPPTCPICNLPTPAASGTPTSCTTFAGTESTYVLLVGDPGLNDHNAGDLFNLAGQTQANNLQSQGHKVIGCRVSSVQDVYNALTKNGNIDGGTYYFGHTGARQTFDVSGNLLSQTSEVFVGEGVGADTNITAQNVRYLRPIQTENGGVNFLGQNAAMWINGCQAGLTILDTSYNGYVSIAQLVSVNLNRGVYAYDVGMYFSHLDIQHDKYTTGVGRRISNVLPIYMIPEGVPGHKPNPLACRPTGGYCSKQ